MNAAMKNTLVFCSLALAPATSDAADAPRPNILLIVADDLGYADVGFHGSQEIITPKLDELAKGGTIFSSAYVVHPFCGPSRMGLLSGRYPHEYGGPFNLPDHSSRQYRDQGIPTSETLIGTVLQNAGYRTGLMGKWHLGQAPEFHPNQRGFDDFYGFVGGGILYFGPYQAQNEEGRIWDYQVFPEHNGVDDTSLTEADYMTDVLTERGVDFIQDAAEKDAPFFLFMSYNAPHTVLAAKEEDKALFPNLSGKRQTYAAMVYSMDQGIGKLVDALKGTGEYENTLIIFLSDNGGRTDQGADNSPLSGVKGDTLEGGFRTPMFFHWPDNVAAGGKYSHPVTALDFYPTFARLAGAETPEGKDLDGKNMWDAFLAGESPRKGEIFYSIRHHRGYSDVGARRDQWKVLRTGMGPWKLYDVDKDPGEQRDLSAQHPETVRQMVTEVEKLTRSHTQPDWFDSHQAEEHWKEANMPHYDKLFQVVAIGPASNAETPESENTAIGGKTGNGDFNADTSGTDARKHIDTDHWFNLTASETGPTATRNTESGLHPFMGDGTRHALLLNGPVFINDTGHTVAAAGEVFQIKLDFRDATPKWIDNKDAVEVFFFTCGVSVDGDTEVGDIKEIASVSFSKITKDNKFEAYSNPAAYTTVSGDVGKTVYVGFRAETDAGIGRVDNFVFEAPPITLEENNASGEPSCVWRTAPADDGHLLLVINLGIEKANLRIASTKQPNKAMTLRDMITGQEAPSSFDLESLGVTLLHVH